VRKKNYIALGEKRKGEEKRPMASRGASRKMEKMEGDEGHLEAGADDL
jgi:hypothetical protein